MQDVQILLRWMSSKIKFPCLACGRKLAVASRDQGLALKCPYCYVFLQTPTGEGDDVKVRIISGSEYRESKAEFESIREEKARRKRALRNRWIGLAGVAGLALVLGFGFLPYLKKRTAQKEEADAGESEATDRAAVIAAADAELARWFKTPTSEIPAIHEYLEQASSWGLAISTPPQYLQVKEVVASAGDRMIVNYLMGQEEELPDTQLGMVYGGEKFEYYPMALVEAAHDVFARFAGGEFAEAGFFFLSLKRVHGVGMDLPAVPEAWGECFWVDANPIMTNKKSRPLLVRQSDILEGRVSPTLTQWGRSVGTECYLHRVEHEGRDILLLKATHVSALEMAQSASDSRPAAP